MAKLSDLININAKEDFIVIQGAEIPIDFNMATLDIISQAYGKSFDQIEKKLNSMMSRKSVSLGHEELRLINALLYGMVRSGGTETTPDELMAAIKVNDIGDVFNKVMEVFNDKYFQPEDAAKIKEPAGAKK